MIKLWETNLGTLRKSVSGSKEHQTLFRVCVQYFFFIANGMEVIQIWSINLLKRRSYNIITLKGDRMFFVCLFFNRYDSEMEACRFLKPSNLTIGIYKTKNAWTSKLSCFETPQWQTYHETQIPDIIEKLFF
jgi:hypothetical protein